MGSMLLFHGTMEPALDGILQHGLQPPRPCDTNHSWVWDLSGRFQGNSVFLSTAPVAGKGGDPVSIAMGWPMKRWRDPHPGYILVVDLPDKALDLIDAVVPNVELDTYIGVSRARAFLRTMFRVEAYRAEQDGSKPLAIWNLSHWCLHYWLARYCDDRRIPLTPTALNDLLPLQVWSVDPALPSDITPTRWQAFVDDYFRFVDFAYQDVRSEAERERRRKNILRRYDLVLPDDVEEDDHRKYCRLCISGLVHFTYRFDDFTNYKPFRTFLDATPKKSSYQRLPDPTRLNVYTLPARVGERTAGHSQSLAMRLRVVAAHTASFPEDSVLRFFRQRESSRKHIGEPLWTWDEWYTQFPAERCTLPSVWQPRYCRRFTAADLKLPDRQVIADAIPPSRIIGAIKISDGARLLPHVRPNRRNGETLTSTLWTLTHQLRARYAGTPVILD